jgi:tRNA threonylcarbamoyladenosine biosynthesis protein TsaB
MRILAIDTSTHVGSVALVDGGALLAETSAFVRAKHGEVLLGHVERVLAAAGVAVRDVDLFAVGVGPGSFTGARIGVATAKGLAFANDKPLRGVVSLAAIARGLGAAGLAATIADAHKGEVFGALYRLAPTGPAALVAPFHAEPARAAAHLRTAAGAGEETLLVAGDGFRRYEDVLRPALGAHAAVAPVFDAPRAAMLALEARDLYEREGPSDLAALEPLYLRASDAKLPESPLALDE